jgi:hypothetical protein
MAIEVDLAIDSSVAFQNEALDDTWDDITATSKIARAIIITLAVSFLLRLLTFFWLIS